MCWYKSRSVAGKLVDTNNLSGDSNKFDFLRLLFPFRRQGLQLAFPSLHPGHSGGAMFVSSLGRMPARHNSLMM